MAEKAAALRDDNEVRTKLHYSACSRERSMRTHSAQAAHVRCGVCAVANQADAEDVAQEVTGSWKTSGNCASAVQYLAYPDMVNEARMWRQSARAHDELIAIREDEEGNYTPRDFADWREIPSETLERHEIRQKLAEALASLGQIYREVFVLRDMQQLSIEETAKALGISTASVKTRLLRARLMLRDLLSPGLGGSWSSPLSFEKGTKPW